MGLDQRAEPMTVRCISDTLDGSPQTNIKHRSTYGLLIFNQTYYQYKIFICERQTLSVLIKDKDNKFNELSVHVWSGCGWLIQFIQISDCNIMVTSA